MYSEGLRKFDPLTQVLSACARTAGVLPARALSPEALPARAPARGALSAVQRGFVRGAKTICLQRKKAPLAEQKEIAILTIIFLTYEHTFI